MLQRLSIAFAQVKAGNTSESLINKIYQIIYSLYPAKNLLKVYNNIYEFNRGIKHNEYYIYDFWN